MAACARGGVYTAFAALRTKNVESMPPPHVDDLLEAPAVALCRPVPGVLLKRAAEELPGEVPMGVEWHAVSLRFAALAPGVRHPWWIESTVDRGKSAGVQA